MQPASRHASLTLKCMSAAKPATTTLPPPKPPIPTNPQHAALHERRIPHQCHHGAGPTCGRRRVWLPGKSAQQGTGFRARRDCQWFWSHMTDSCAVPLSCALP